MSSLPVVDISSPQDVPVAEPRQAENRARVLVCLPSVAPDMLHALLDHLVEALPHQNLLIASPDVPAEAVAPGEVVQIVPYPPQAPHPGWILTAADYAAASNLLREHNASTALLLGPEAASLSVEALRGMVSLVQDGGADLALPRYEVGPHEGLVTAAFLYPLSRALFGASAHTPLPLDAAFSARMAARLSVAAKKPAGNSGSEPLLWPTAEAAAASMQVREVQVGRRTLPQPDSSDLNGLLAYIAGSFFADIELKAAIWQRARSAPPSASTTAVANGHAPESSPNDLEEVKAMANDFRNAYTNLQEIWSLVVPPQSLLALKKLSLSSPDSFTMPVSLWARSVYDFVLAYRLRTINRGHLLGALTPMYLAWVASHLRRAENDIAASERHIEETADAFVAEKPYILARWRWPDRFNP